MLFLEGLHCSGTQIQKKHSFTTGLTESFSVAGGLGGD